MKTLTLYCHRKINDAEGNTVWFTLGGSETQLKLDLHSGDEDYNLFRVGKYYTVTIQPKEQTELSTNANSR